MTVAVPLTTLCEPYGFKAGERPEYPIIVPPWVAFGVAPCLGGCTESGYD
jgi:hypothetical protein